MNPQVKAEWVAALRDPEAKQTTGVLGNESGNCCLGVLCDIAVAHGIIAPPTQSVHPLSDKTVNAYGNDGDTTQLPFEVSVWAGFEGRTNFKVKVSEERAKSEAYATSKTPDRWWISDVNDNGGTFAEIADYIEEQL